MTGGAGSVPGTLRERLRRLEGLTAPVGSVTAVRTLEPVVVLTYDDGPDPVGTPAVLAALEEWGASATFFVLGTRLRRHPEVLADVLAAGHEVALHGSDHRALTSLSREDLRPVLRAGRQELEDRTGTPVRWLRPPYGRQSWATWRAARAEGLEPVMWGPSLRDNRRGVTPSAVTSVLPRLHRGALVLAHDGFAGPADGVDDGPAPQVDRGALAHGLLRGMAGMGLKGVSLGAALEHGRLHRRAWFGR